MLADVLPWWREEAVRRRDAILRELAATFQPTQSASMQAKWIHMRAVRYAASAWRHDRARENMPPHYAGKPSVYLWQAFKSGAPMPICERQLRTVLAHSPSPRAMVTSAPLGSA
jgi:hypothetical protein